MTFYGDDFREHTSCISEAEKYEGALYRGPGSKKAKKRNPQELWMDVVEEAVAQAADAPANLKSFLQAMDGLGNVPRNGKKFKNFVRNSLRMRSEPTIDQLWDYLEARQQKARKEMEEALAVEKGGGGKGAEGAAEEETKAADEKADSATESKKRPRADDAAAVAAEEKKEEEDEVGASSPSKKSKTVGGGADKAEKVKWGKVIQSMLKAAPGKTMKVKELKKKVLAGLANGKELKETFDKQLAKAAAGGRCTLSGKSATYAKKGS